jgi:hypothetical protein
MDVDEARGHEQVARIDFLDACTVDATNRADAALADGDISDVAGAAVAIDDRAPADDQIVSSAH